MIPLVIKNKERAEQTASQKIFEKNSLKEVESIAIYCQRKLRKSRRHQEEIARLADSNDRFFLQYAKQHGMKIDMARYHLPHYRPRFLLQLQ